MELAKKKKLKDGFLFYLVVLLLHNIQRQLKKLLLTCLGKKNVKKYHSINKIIVLFFYYNFPCVYATYC